MSRDCLKAGARNILRSASVQVESRSGGSSCPRYPGVCAILYGVFDRRFYNRYRSRQCPAFADTSPSPPRSTRNSSTPNPTVVSSSAPSGTAFLRNDSLVARLSRSDQDGFRRALTRWSGEFAMKRLGLRVHQHPHDGASLFKGRCSNRRMARCQLSFKVREALWRKTGALVAVLAQHGPCSEVTQNSTSR